MEGGTDGGRDVMRGGRDSRRRYELIRHNVSSQMKYNVMYYTDFHFSEHGTSSINHSSVRSFCIFQLRVLFICRRVFLRSAQTRV